MKRCKYIVGLALFWLSCLLWLVGIGMPFLLDMDAERMAGLVVAILVVSEIMFTVSLLLLGRPFYQAVKQYLKHHWNKIFSKKPTC